MAHGKSKGKFFGDCFDGYRVKVEPFIYTGQQEKRGCLKYTDHKDREDSRRDDSSFRRGDPTLQCLCYPSYPGVKVLTHVETPYPYMAPPSASVSYVQCPVHPTKCGYSAPRCRTPPRHDYYRDYPSEKGNHDMRREMQFTPHVHFMSPVASRYN